MDTTAVCASSAMLPMRYILFHLDGIFSVLHIFFSSSIVTGYWERQKMAHGHVSHFAIYGRLESIQARTIHTFG